MTKMEFASRTGSPDISIRNLIAPLFRRKHLLLTVFLSVLVVLILAGLLWPTPYKAHMAVLVNRERLDPIVTTESTTQVPVGATEVTLEEINSESELLTSADVLRQVVLASGLANQTSVLDFLLPTRTQEEKVQRAMKKLAKDLKVENPTNSNVIDISYSSPDPKLSYSVLAYLSKFYLEKHASLHRPQGSFEFFDEQTKRYYDALQASETNLKNFSRQQRVAAPDQVQADLAQEVATAIGQLYATKQTIAADEERIRNDKHQMNATPSRSSTSESTSAADRLLEDLNDSLVAAQTKRTQLAMKYDPSHPLVKEADQEIAQIQTAIERAGKTRFVTETTDRDPTYELLREDLAKTEADLASQRAGAAAAEKGIGSMRAQMVDLSEKALTQQDLLRDAKANEGDYLLYLSKREQERTSDALDKTRISNVEIAVPPIMPVLPLYSIPTVIALAFGIAFLLSLTTVYVVDYVDSSFHTPSQVIEALGVPIVIAVPKKKTA